MALMKVKRAFKHAVPPAADRELEPDDEVLIRREKKGNRRIGEWLGPHVVVGTVPERKLVYVRDSVIGPARP